MSEPAPDNIRPLDPVRAESAPDSVEAPPQDRRPLWIGLVLVVALVAMSVLFFRETRRADALESEVGRLTAELQASRRTVEAYKGHLGQVRGHVGDLSHQMQALKDLVESDPEAVQSLPEAAAKPSDEAL